MKFALTKDCSDAFADKINQTITRRETETVIRRSSHYVDNDRFKCIWISDSIIRDAHLQAYRTEPIMVYENIAGVTGDDETFLDTLVKDVLGDLHPLSSVDGGQTYLTWRDVGGVETKEAEVVTGFSINTRFYSKDDFFTLYDNIAINKR